VRGVAISCIVFPLHFWAHRSDQESVCPKQASRRWISSSRRTPASEVSLAQFRGTRWVVISAYPFSFTGG